jgi:hypothetical protein
VSAAPAAPEVPYPAALERFPTVRQSLLASFHNCAQSTGFELDFRNGWSTHPQARGTTFHRVAARCLREMHAIGDTRIPVDVALAILHEVLRQDDVDQECPTCHTAEIKPGIRDGFRTCSAGHRFETDLMNVPMSEVADLYWTVKKWAHDNEFDTDNLLDVETRLYAPVRYPNPHGGQVERVVSGQLDVVIADRHAIDHLIVLDHKDTWMLPPPTEVSFEGYFQQRLYGWLLMRQRHLKHVDRVTLREFYVRYSEPREVTLWRDDLLDVEEEIAALVKRFDRTVQEQLWANPTPGKHCALCLRPTACPIFPEGRGIGRIRSAEEATKVVGQLAVAEAAARQLREAAQAYSDLHGPIPLRDAKGRRAYGFKTTQSVQKPSRDKLEARLRNGGPLSQRDLDRLYPVRRGTRWSQYVPPRAKPEQTDEEMLATLQQAVSEAKAKRS